jgi:flagellar protein FlaG
MEAAGSVKSMETRGIEAVVPLKGADPPLSRQDKTRESARHAAGQRQVDKAQLETRTRAKIERIAQVMDDYVRSTQRSLRIQVHQGTGDFMVKVVSKVDGRTIREIPPEEVLNLAAKMEEMMGLLFNERV